jgi:hypothetical protein
VGVLLCFSWGGGIYYANWGKKHTKHPENFIFFEQPRHRSVFYFDEIGPNDSKDEEFPHNGSNCINTNQTFCGEYE